MKSNAGLMMLTIKNKCNNSCPYCLFIAVGYDDDDASIRLKIHLHNTHKEK